MSFIAAYGFVWLLLFLGSVAYALIGSCRYAMRAERGEMTPCGFALAEASVIVAALVAAASFILLFVAVLAHLGIFLIK